MVRLTHDPIDVGALTPATAEDGAACLFLGVVRNENGGRPVRHLEYEAYEEMALPLMEEIAAEARRRWPVTEVRIVHRLGRLEIGEPSVAVAVTAPHRGAAFEACRYAIDTLKATVPIWKKEFYADGAVWLEGPGSAPVEVTARGTWTSVASRPSGQQSLRRDELGQAIGHDQAPHRGRMVVVEEVIRGGKAVRLRTRAEHRQQIQRGDAQAPGEFEQPPLRVISAASH